MHTRDEIFKILDAFFNRGLSKRRPVDKENSLSIARVVVVLLGLKGWKEILTTTGSCHDALDRTWYSAQPMG